MCTSSLTESTGHSSTLNAWDTAQATPRQCGAQASLLAGFSLRGLQTQLMAVSYLSHSCSPGLCQQRRSCRPQHLWYAVPRQQRVRRAWPLRCTSTSPGGTSTAQNRFELLTVTLRKPLGLVLAEAPAGSARSVVVESIAGALWPGSTTQSQAWLLCLPASIRSSMNIPYWRPTPTLATQRAATLQRAGWSAKGTTSTGAVLHF